MGSYKDKCQSSLWTHRYHLLSLRLGFWGRIEQVGNIGPSAHLQPVGDPLQTHSRFLAKAARQPDLRRVPLAARPQLILIPAEPLDFLPHNSLGFLQASFLTLRAVMARPDSLDHRRQQFLTERLGTQHPVAANLLIIRRRLLRPPTLHQRGKMLATSLTVL